MAGKSLRRRLTDTFITAAMRPPLGLPRLGRPDVELRGKKVLLTGASSGIGAAATEKFAAAGAEVIAVARRGDLLDELATRIGAAGGQIRTAVCDVTDMDAVDALVEEVGAVDILVNNAGRSIRRPLAESLERWHDVERTMAVNYYAPMRLMRGFVPGMLERGRGHIVNIGSISGRGGGGSAAGRALEAVAWGAAALALPVGAAVCPATRAAASWR